MDADGSIITPRSSKSSHIGTPHSSCQDERAALSARDPVVRLVSPPLQAFFGCFFFLPCHHHHRRKSFAFQRPRRSRSSWISLVENWVRPSKERMAGEGNIVYRQTCLSWIGTWFFGGRWPVVVFWQRDTHARVDVSQDTLRSRNALAS
jgi:hypothetical protein